MSTREEDQLEHLIAAGTLNTMLFFTNQGKVYVDQGVPDSGIGPNGQGDVDDEYPAPAAG
jgi:DNA gyrase/topoisomerase IV subunit A